MAMPGNSQELTCAEAQRLLQRDLFGESLAIPSYRMVSGHLKHCAKCREVVSRTSAVPFFADEFSQCELNMVMDQVNPRRWILPLTAFLLTAVLSSMLWSILIG